MLFFKSFLIKRLTKKLVQLQKNRIHNVPSEALLQQERQGYHLLSKRYAALEGAKPFPFAKECKIACYRAAAMIDDLTAQYTLGKMLLDEAVFRLSWEKEGLFASQSNVKTMTQLFEEAHAYLQAAEAQQHIEAKRLRGLCYINGWGVPADKKQGFELIVESIQQENSWDRVPQIFETLGLNKPEFFSELTQIRQKNKP